MFEIIALVAWIIALAYVALACGPKAKEPEQTGKLPDHGWDA